MHSIEKCSSKYWKIHGHELYEGRVFAINWETINFGNSGSKHQRSYLLLSMREFMESYLQDRSLDSSASISPGTITNIFSRQRTLVHWMIENEFWRFSQLTQHDLLEFMESRIAQSKEGNLTDKTVKSYLKLFQAMWELRGSYVGSLRVDQFEIEELSSAFKFVRPSSRWKPIEMDHALLMLKDAVEWMESTAPKIIELVDELYAIRSKYVGKSIKYRKNLSKQTYCEIAQTDAYKIIATKLNYKEARSYDVVRYGIKMTLGAAITILLLLTGMRISEILSLKRNCVCEKTHDDGYVYTYIRGVAAKKGGKKREWIAPEPVIKTIEILEGLFNGSAKYISTKHLFFSFSGNGALPLTKTKLSRMISQTAGKWFKEFACATWREIPFPTNKRLHPHQARKTFAKFVVKRDKRALGALAQHYGHVYAAVLDNAYVGTDIELEHLLKEETRHELAAGLTDILRSENLAGKAATDIRAFQNKHFPNGFPGKRALQNVVNKLLDDGVTLAPCNWGYCLYAADVSACRGNELGPNEVQRCPSTCSSCKNFVVTNVHRSWWENRYLEDSAFLKRKNLPIQAKLIVERKQQESARILSEINGSHFAKENIK